jgi:Uma2 family endonuclease
MVQIPEKIIPLEEFLKKPETTPASEYIDGQIIQKPMPQGKHSRIQGEAVTVINAEVKQQRIACAFPELRCTFGGRSIVPDVSVFAWKRIPTDDLPIWTTTEPVRVRAGCFTCSRFNV